MRAAERIRQIDERGSVILLTTLTQYGKTPGAQEELARVVLEVNSRTAAAHTDGRPLTSE